MKFDKESKSEENFFFLVGGGGGGGERERERERYIEGDYSQLRLMSGDKYLHPYYLLTDLDFSD